MRSWSLDPAEEVAQVASARRELLLRAHRHRLRREDLEDCYSQATLELVRDARRGAAYASRRHIEIAIEGRFVSRIRDRRRAISGRSPIQAALEQSVSLAGLGEPGVDVVDSRAELERLVLLRQDLRRVALVARYLTPDQRLVLACQVALQMPRDEFCLRFGWSPEKYRKVAQRARARLGRLMSSDVPDVPTVRRRSEEEPRTIL
jgi:DNA-directed RNA polymerase specialized sigma24 family protein